MVRSCLDWCREPQYCQSVDGDFEAYMYTNVIEELERVKFQMVNEDC